MESLTFIIPAYNDEETIETVVRNAFRIGKKLGIPFDMLVVNDASRDGTGRILKALQKRYPRLTVLTHTKNAGYGLTMKQLYKKASATWLFSLPGDYQIDPGELMSLWPHRRKADMIIGWRTVRRDSPARLHQSRIYNRLLRTVFGLSIHDVNSIRLMRTSVMKVIRLSSSSAFVDAELVIRAVKRGLRVMEIPVAHRARAGSGAGGGKLTTIVPTIGDMLLFLFHASGT